MTLARQDVFLESLQNLQRSYPEYHKILQELIDQIKQGKNARVQMRVNQLDDDNW